MRARSPQQFACPRLSLEEILDLLEPALGARVVARAVFVADRFELAQQLALALGELDRRLHHHVAEEVALHLAAHALDPLALQAELLAALRFGGHPDARRAVERSEERRVGKECRS